MFRISSSRLELVDIGDSLGQGLLDEVVSIRRVAAEGAGESSESGNEIDNCRLLIRDPYNTGFMRWQRIRLLWNSIDYIWRTTSRERTSA